MRAWRLPDHHPGSPMSAYRSLTTLSLAALLGYGLGVTGLIQGYLAHLPEGEVRVALLQTLIADLQTVEADWTAKTRRQREALNDRDTLFDDGMKLYTPARKWTETLARGKRKHRAHMRDLLAQCPAPSELTPSDAFLA